MKIIIKEEQAGKRVDQILQEAFPSLSRSQVHKQFFDRDLVRVGEKSVTKHYRVKSGDIIEVSVIPATEPESRERSAKQPRGYEASESSHAKPAILFENDSYIVLDKPSGLLTHPSSVIPAKAGIQERQATPNAERMRGNGSSFTLVDFLLLHYPPIRKVGDDPLRPGIVHRLDKDASGVMVAAKTQAAFDVLKRQFKLRQVKKEYLVLVYGAMPRMEGDITFSLGRARHSPRFATQSGEAGRKAATHYVVEEQFSRYSLVRATPSTGRTHQIRVHFFAYGHPVVGDSIYMSKSIKKVGDVRLMLHATRLGFHDVDGAWQDYTCPPGEDFMAVVEQLRNGH